MFILASSISMSQKQAIQSELQYCIIQYTINQYSKSAVLCCIVAEIINITKTHTQFITSFLQSLLPIS